MNIVCLSPAPWDYPIWTNRQHIMARMAKCHKVIYVFQPVFFKSSIKRNVSLKETKKISMLKKINDNLWTYTPFIIPFSNKSLFIHRINVKISSMFLKKILLLLGFDNYLLWFYDPEGVVYLDYLNPKLTCYDCVDEYSTMPYYNSSKRRKERLNRLENELIKKCDLVFTTAQNLYKQKKRLNPKTYLVENVGDFDHFNEVEREKLHTPTDISKIPSPIIGFVGALDDYKVDHDLLEYIAVKKPNWSIVLIGSKMNSKEKTDTFSKNDNIFYLGRKDYKKLPQYISHFDVCIIPYKINDYTKHVFPIKFFEFLSTGKPVITTALPALKKYSRTARIASSYNEFIQAIEESIHYDSEGLKEKRINLAKNNTWEYRTEKLLSYINEFIEAQN
jgi:hypothetical protein